LDIVKNQTLSISIAIIVAILVGFAHIVYLLKVFSFLYANVTPLALLSDLGLRGTPLNIGVATVDWIIATAISIPTAFILLKLQTQRVWLCAWLAAIVGFFAINSSRLFDPSQLLESWLNILAGFVTLIFPIPLAVLLLRKFLTQTAPNKPFKQDTSDAGAS